MTRTPTEFLKEFQRRAGLLADGEAGSLTNAALDRVFGVVPPVTSTTTTGTVPASISGLVSTSTLQSRLAAAIIDQGRRFCGLQEVRPNQNWDNPDTKGADLALVTELRDGMRKSPWEPGWAYCAAFAEFIVANALSQIGATPEQVAKFRAVMSPHCMTSVRAFKPLGLLMPTPAPGAIWLARHGSTDNGHAGIVVTPHTPHMDTVEANTSFDSGGNQREGDWITNRIRPIAGPGELRTQGFVHPTAILKLCGLA
jgi:hypothetical protein